MRTIRSASISLLILLVLAGAGGCADRKVTPSAGRYFATRWQSWLGYDEHSLILIQIALIHTPAAGVKDDIATAALGRDGGHRVMIDDWRLNEGPDINGYRLLTLSLVLDELPPGIHEYDRLELTFSDRSFGEWDIGNWMIDVRTGTDDGAEYISLGKHSGVSGELDWNRFELTNVSDGGIVIKGLIFDLPGITTDGEVLTSDEFLPGGESRDPQALSLPPGHTRTFQFNLHSDTSAGAGFFTIKPRLAIEADGREIQATLPAVIYAPLNLTDDEIRDLIATGGKLR